MVNAVLDQLTTLIEQYGQGIVNDTRRCEALLRDLCAGQPREVNLLITALRAGVPSQLAESGPSAPIQVVVARLVGYLSYAHGLADGAASWAVESWAVALGLMGADDAAAAAKAKQRAAPEGGPPSRPVGANQSTGLPGDWPAYLSRWRQQMPTNLQYRLARKDCMPQVLIPEGAFLMGRSTLLNFLNDEHPQKRVCLSAYWMDVHAVTVSQYRRFCEATGRTMAPAPSFAQTDDHPVVNVSWDDATAYAQWVGRTLPTEAQRERAARGGLEGKAYPWGDTFDASKCAGNGKGTEPVGSYAPNGLGLYDMAGNVGEWCRDWYDASYYARMSDRDPENTAPGDDRVYRGGSWSYFPVRLRVAYRSWYSPSNRYFNLGFRGAEAP